MGADKEKEADNFRRVMASRIKEFEKLRSAPGPKTRRFLETYGKYGAMVTTNTGHGNLGPTTSSTHEGDLTGSYEAEANRMYLEAKNEVVGDQGLNISVAGNEAGRFASTNSSQAVNDVILEQGLNISVAVNEAGRFAPATSTSSTQHGNQSGLKENEDAERVPNDSKGFRGD